ncbi:protein ANTAGONIST OF LIKE HETEROCHROMATIN PROTEIN 1-like [Coccinella septempunctata]|uniref:protein ANTAGONIST OF LIKE HETEROCHROMATIN PROTEIN 1-like n=1 Tax=Coccinella septempunctata TaxID=41139 RepID=UPI001D05D462|nr:protein ANTAGONIST OF LIKE HETEROCHROMATIN PROTEIN 1-like [Coccinella septempunctata]
MENLGCASASFIILYELLKKKRRRRSRLSSQLYLQRSRDRSLNNTFLLRDIQSEGDGRRFKNFTRMSEADFSFLLDAIKDKISRRDTEFRMAIPAEERLALTLRFLASGDSFTSLQYMWKISKQLISRIVPEVCEALVDVLMEYIKLPSSPAEWEEIAQQFENVWNFPNCLGAIDGKHIVIQAPIKSGSEYINYKSQFSIVLMALVDAEYNFTFVDIGCQGRISDGGVFNNCKLYHKIEDGSLNIPAPKPLPGRSLKLPYVFVADAAFPLTENIMKPYSGYHPKDTAERAYNYRLSRARRIVENAFGIASSVFRVLRKPLLLKPEKATLIVMTVVCLHNFLRRSKTSKHLYSPVGSLDTEKEGELIPGTWRAEEKELASLLPLKNIPRRNKESVAAIRNEFAKYFKESGALTWQNKYM